jgi:hypothetical protein
MKHLKFLLILSLTVTLFSCDSDDDGGVIVAPSPNADLLGTWTGTSITGGITGNTVDSSDNSNVPYSGTIVGSNLNFTITFTETPNNLTSQGTFDVTASIVTGGQTQTITNSGETFLVVSPAAWTRSATTLTITDNGVTESFSLSINGASMTLSKSETDTDMDGTETNTSTTITTATFAKQ